MAYNHTEEPADLARRHVQQAERLVAGQEALITRLQRNGYVELAEEATEVLDNLVTSLTLARPDLAELEANRRPRFLDMMARRYGDVSNMCPPSTDVTRSAIYKCHSSVAGVGRHR